MQGSFLRPLLFLIHINDIINSSYILSFVLFADDTKYIFNMIHDIIDGAIKILNSELAEVTEWFDFQGQFDFKRKISKGK